MNLYSEFLKNQFDKISELKLVSKKKVIEIKIIILKIYFNFSLNFFIWLFDDKISNKYAGMPKDKIAPPKLINVINRARIPYSVGDKTFVETNI